MTKKMELKVSPQDHVYDIVVENGAIDEIEKYIDLSGKVLIVTDNGVPETYSEKIASKAASKYLYVIPQGEKYKTIDTYRQIIAFMVDNSFTRTDKVIAVGGGVVGDIAGFVAATFMRGISFYNVPTTLLSQVDASIGGKTAVNFDGVKNIVGAFHHPKKVIVDPSTLKTLSPSLLHNGLAEAIKLSAIADEDLFGLIENSHCLDDDLQEIIYRSLMIKKEIVEMDPLEKGSRRMLNFGHTIGHPIEAAYDGKILHGEAVGIGMLYFAAEEPATRIRNLLVKYNLPTSCEMSTDTLKTLISHDKKASGNNVTVVWVDKIGCCEMRSMSVEDIVSLFENKNIMQ